MAQVAQEPQTRARIDDDLDYLLREWNRLPRIAKEWEDWDELDRLVFVLEWPMRVDRMTRLEAWAEQNALSDAQQARYRDLLDMSSRYRPILDQLLAD